MLEKKEPKAPKTPTITPTITPTEKTEPPIIEEKGSVKIGELKPEDLSPTVKLKNGEGKTFEVPRAWLSEVIVWQRKVEIMNGGLVEVPNTHGLQTYAPDVFKRLSAEGKNGEPSFFSESKYKLDILHTPGE